MKIIRPVAITTAMITASNVPETDYAAYAGGTTYYSGDRVIVAAEHKIYESLPPTTRQILTLDVAPGIPWLPNQTLTGQTSLATCVVVAYITALTYYIKDRSGTFTLGEIIGVTGVAVLLADQGAGNPGFSSASNVGHDPVVDCALATPLWWKEVSATNRWKAFDNKVGSQVSMADSITYTITPGVLFDSIAFLSLDAETVQIVITDPVAGVVYDKTISLLSTVGITGTSEVYDWYTYFFSSYFRISDIVRFDITPYLNAVIDITISYAGGTALVGGVVLGLQTFIGTTRPGPSIGIHDYSTKETDAYGVYSVVEGAFSKRLSVDLLLQNTIIDNVQNLLAYYRSKLIVWVASENYTSLIVYGYYKDFSIVVPYPKYSVCSLEIEGLI